MCETERLDQTLAIIVLPLSVCQIESVGVDI